MPLSNLTAIEQDVIRECLQASVDGPFFPNFEFETIFGLTRDDVQAVLNRWPLDDKRDGVAQLAINNALNNLLGYPHGWEDVWPRYISVTPAEVGRIFARWRGEPVEGYFDGLE